VLGLSWRRLAASCLRFGGKVICFFECIHIFISALVAEFPWFQNTRLSAPSEQKSSALACFARPVTNLLWKLH
jgi:hypothetical protein